MARSVLAVLGEDHCVPRLERGLRLKAEVAAGSTSNGIRLRSSTRGRPEIPAKLRLSH